MSDDADAASDGDRESGAAANGDGGNGDGDGENGDGDGGNGDGDGGNGDGENVDHRPDNDGQRFDRLPATDADRVDPERPTREAVLDWWDRRYGVPADTFAGHTFWEKGRGQIWALAGDAVDPCRVEALGMKVLRTRREHWKPTTDGVARFARDATRNVVELDAEEARRFLAGEDQELDWDGDWGFLIGAREMAGGREPIGVGLYVYGELRSMVPKGRRREFDGGQ